MDPKVAEVIKRRLTEDLLPERPALWIYIDQEFPKATDLFIPKIHFDEIVDPVDRICAPPRF